MKEPHQIVIVVKRLLSTKSIGIADHGIWAQRVHHLVHVLTNQYMCQDVLVTNKVFIQTVIQSHVEAIHSIQEIFNHTAGTMLHIMITYHVQKD